MRGAFVGAPSSFCWDRHAASLTRAAAFASLSRRFCVPKAFCNASTSMVSPDLRRATFKPLSLDGVTFCRWSSVAASAVAAFREDGTGAVLARRGPGLLPRGRSSYRNLGEAQELGDVHLIITRGRRGYGFVQRAARQPPFHALRRLGRQARRDAQTQAHHLLLEVATWNHRRSEPPL